jgi:hypothetical protein
MDDASQSSSSSSSSLCCILLILFLFPSLIPIESVKQMVLTVKGQGGGDTSSSSDLSFSDSSD